MKAPRPGLGEKTSRVMDNRSGLFAVQKGETYQAALSKCDTCSFVEGHECLSPTTRDRFIVRKDIKWGMVTNANRVGEVTDEVAAEGVVTERVLAVERAREENASQTAPLDEVDGLTASMNRL